MEVGKSERDQKIDRDCRPADRIHDAIECSHEGNNSTTAHVGATRQGLTRATSCGTPLPDITTDGIEESPLLFLLLCKFFQSLNFLALRFFPRFAFRFHFKFLGLYE